MKKNLFKVVSFLLIFSILFCNHFTVYASDHGGGGTSSSFRNLIKAQESRENKEKVEKFFREYFVDVNGFFAYAASQVGAVLSGDYSGAYQSYLSMEDIINSSGLYVDDSGNPTGFYVSSDLMEQIKSLLDQYGKENEPYFLVPVSSYRDLDVTRFSNKAQYETICHLAKEYGLIGINGTQIADLSPIQKNGYSFVASGTYTDKDLSVTPVWTCAYNADWQWRGFYFYRFDFANRTEKYTSFDQGTKSTDLGLNVELFSYLSPNFTICNRGSIMNSFSSISNAQKASMISRDRVRIRVYNTLDDSKRYTVGQRHVYYTTNYYEYVPTDISVSNDELQQGVSDINTALDKLLEQIDNNTSETDIEKLLQQILDELKNSGGSGGEDPSPNPGPGGGTVDMSTTNSWLAKIYAKVSDIFDKMEQGGDTSGSGSGGNNQSVSENSIGLSDLNNVLKLIWANTNVIVEKLMFEDGQGSQDNDSVSQNSVSGNSIDLSGTNFILDSIKAGIDEIIELLKKIKGWAIADTILDGVGAISDLVSLVADFLNDAGAVVSSAADSLGETANMMTDKFPFSIPWDLAMLVSILQAEPRAPVFHLPLVIQSYGIEESIDIDMSQFNALSVIMRSMLTILYAYGILNMTTKVLNFGGGNK